MRYEKVEGTHLDVYRDHELLWSASDGQTYNLLPLLFLICITDNLVSSNNIKEDYVISSLSGSLHYGLDVDEVPVAKDSSYLVNKENMIQFLKDAAKNIDTYENFENDPISKFPSKYNLYNLWLVLMSVNFILLMFNLWDFIFISKELQQSLKYALVW